MSAPVFAREAAPSGAVIIPFPGAVVSRPASPIDPRLIVKTCGGTAAAVYAVVKANDEEAVPNTYVTLAEQFGYSARQMLRLVQRMEQEGFVEVTRSVGKSHASTIHATTLGVTTGVTPVSEQPPRGDTDVSPVGVTSGVTLPPHTPLTTEQKTNNDEKEAPLSPPSKPKRQRTATPSIATPIPSLAEFEVSEEMRAKAVGYGVPAEMIDLETEKWWHHHDARGNRFKNWRSSWYGWMAKAPAMSGYKHRNGHQNGTVRFDANGLPIMANGAVDMRKAQEMGLLG